MEIEKLTVDEIARGYATDEASGVYRCLICGKTFEEGEVYPAGDRFFEARRGAELHAQSAHGDYLERLIEDDSKYNALTDNQKRLLRLFAAGVPDKEIAQELGIATSTVRHQKFVFREKAKQAKWYLAIYERAFENRAETAEVIMPIHSHATMVDERYVVTEAEREKILHAVFESLSPLKLKSFPPKQKKKVVILSKIAELFEPNRRYTEKEVNAIIADVYDDYVTIRRYLIDYGFMDRTQDSSAYWMR